MSTLKQYRELIEALLDKPDEGQEVVVNSNGVKGAMSLKRSSPDRGH